MAHKPITTMLCAVAAGALLIAGCGDAGTDSAPEPTTQTPGSVAPATPLSEESMSDSPSSPVESSPSVDEATTPAAEPVTQEESCGWDSAPLPAGSADDAPTNPGDADIGSVLIGAWQHTHIDAGPGFEGLEPDTDIRFIFPSTSRILYCQDIADITDEAENPADFELVGTDIKLPGDSPGYTVIAWDDDSMVWKNNLDESLYLLKRR